MKELEPIGNDFRRCEAGKIRALLKHMNDEARDEDEEDEDEEEFYDNEEEQGRLSSDDGEKADNNKIVEHSDEDEFEERGNVKSEIGKLIEEYRVKRQSIGKGDSVGFT